MSLFGGIEAGGTNFVCAIGTSPEDIRAELRFPTTENPLDKDPLDTIRRAAQFFRDYSEPLTAIGIASFGPLDLDPASETYGFITTTPKEGWENFDFVGAVRKELNLPIAFDTDVNGAALAEHKWGATQDVDSSVYLTVGTGIGGGAVINDRLIHGLVHPEMGHIMLPISEKYPQFKGICSYHGNCLEGLASGSAIKACWGQAADRLPPNHRAWTLEAHYLALGLCNIILPLSPQRIVLGGGVMHQAQLLPLIRDEVRRILNGYVQSGAITQNIDRYIVPPLLGDRAGVLGAIALASGA